MRGYICQQIKKVRSQSKNIYYKCLLNEPPRDKTNKMAYALSEDSDLRWAHSHLVGFVTRRLNCLTLSSSKCYSEC